MKKYLPIISIFFLGVTLFSLVLYPIISPILGVIVSLLTLALTPSTKGECLKERTNEIDQVRRIFRESTLRQLSMIVAIYKELNVLRQGLHSS